MTNSGELEEVRTLTQQVIARLKGELEAGEVEIEDIERDGNPSRESEVLAISRKLFRTREQLLKIETLAQRLEPNPNVDDFSGLVRLLTTREMRAREGRYNRLCQMAAAKEVERLSQPIWFTPTECDYPFLNANTVEGEECEPF